MNCSGLWWIFQESGRLLKVCWTSPEFRGLWQILVDYSGLFKSAKVRRSPQEKYYLTDTVGLWQSPTDSGGPWWSPQKLEIIQLCLRMLVLVWCYLLNLNEISQIILSNPPKLMLNRAFYFYNFNMY